MNDRLVRAPPEEDQPDSRRAAVIDYLTSLENAKYLRSREIAPDLDLGSVQVGQVLADLADHDTDAPVTVEAWSTSRNGSTVWRITPTADGDRDD